MVSGSISLPSPGFFSLFPHGTCSLSVSKEYLALEDGPPARRPLKTTLLPAYFVAHSSRCSFTLSKLRCSTLSLLVCCRILIFKWAPLLQTGFLVSRPTFRTLALIPSFTYGAITLFGWLFHTISLNHISFPRSGSFPFARHYLGNLG